MNLKKAALAFEELLDIEYKIILGRKEVTTEFTIRFIKDNFFHLVGLQYLDDIDFPTKNKRKIFDLILEEKITYDFIKKSSKIESVAKERINPMINILNIMDSNNLAFKFNKSTYNWCKIRCSFVLENVGHGTPIYIFIDNEGKEKSIMFCRSFFIKGSTDFTKGNAKMALLYKEKINKKTGETKIQLDKFN